MGIQYCLVCLFFLIDLNMRLKTVMGKKTFLIVQSRYKFWYGTDLREFCEEIALFHQEY